MTTGELIGTGRQADVYALDAHRVLRRYRDGTDATREAEIMERLSRFDFPIPQVYEATGPDLVMERLDGPTMTAAYAAGRLAVQEGASCLADLHRRLHDVPFPGGRILHRDLHPENVMLTRRGPVVIDWNNAALGRPAVDVALTAVILGQVALDPAHPMAEPAHAFLSAYVRIAGEEVHAGLGEALVIRAADPALTDEDAARLPEVRRFLS
ncbi:phosphotransferase [Actinoplanes sp. OR16]|uniref:phosphotransferase n=1 Tax=Actinoplanes sp. OR16 TaxID=946334 RepID=UPI000FDA4D34|nr:phosphotransferase [Actinoplanes sp. OR16]